MKLIPGHLQGDDVLEAFRDGPMPLIAQIVRDAGYDPSEWTITVFGVHKYGSHPRPSQIVLRLGAVRDSTRHIDINVKPTKGQHTFDARLCVPRSLDFVAVSNQIAGAVRQHGKPKPLPAPKPAPTPPSAIAPAPPSPPAPAKAAELIANGMARLEGLRTGLDAVLAMGRDAKASAEMRAEIQERHDAAAEKARPLLAELDQAETLLRQHERHMAAITDDVRHTEDRLVLLKASLEKATEEHRQAEAAYALAEAAAREPAAAWDAAAAELAESERLESERLKAINETPGIAGLLAALEAMNAK